MKHAIRFALAATAVLLAACAGTAPPSSTVAASSGTLYCHKDRLIETASGYECNWASQARDVCDGSIPATVVSKTSVAAPPANGNRCASGLWLATVATR